MIALYPGGKARDEQESQDGPHQDHPDGHL